VEDARRAYEAIRLAQPGGLGDAPRHDVREEPAVTLLAAMAEASERDAIAAQYANGYADVFDIGLAALRRARLRRRSEAWGATAAYLEFAARLPDSHVIRRHGRGTALRVAACAAALSRRLDASADARELAEPLLAWDRELKRDGINPGTSADLTVAAALALWIEDRMQDEFTAAGPAAGLRGNAMWDEAHDVSTN
jgi:triphosphoribosyl-dephospho-CoA synthase